ncbi:acyltransferase domain-containing protein [Streptomyces melanogenes]|uniref:Acyltransferase domain-containing protein n=1 Tax=Streptomyces melanogenes TaxID=67326 RepID=A0ABZ1XIH6_9ACTN|nr:acyltransferase domain-containing protein [Streptomyces melanogenes]
MVDEDELLPVGDELPEVLLDLAVPHEDINELVGIARRLGGDPEVCGLLEESVRVLVRDIGSVGFQPEMPAVPEGLGGAGAVRRLFPVLVLLATLPHTRAYHDECAVPADIARRTLADLGRHLAVHRRRYGNAGLVDPRWLWPHFRGELYQLGRLQFQRARLGERTGEAVRAAGLPLGPGDACLSIHIPDFRGPLTPRACDASLALARDFFALHYPEETYRVAVCHSWLLDAQLEKHLPEESNIVRFQRRFSTSYRETEADDRLPVFFVFGDPDLPVEALLQRTAVERAVAGHLLAGEHWYRGHGWFEL